MDKNYINKQEFILNEQIKNKVDVVNAYYFKLGNNVFIHIDLNVKSNYSDVGIENGINISELPIGYRPQKTLRVPCFIMNKSKRHIGSMDIYTSGAIHFYSDYPNHIILLANCSFISVS